MARAMCSLYLLHHVTHADSVVCLFVVCPQHKSKKNDLKVFKLGTGNDLWISYKRYGFGVERSKFTVTGSISAFFTLPSAA